MLDDLFVPDPPAGDSSNQIPNTRFVTVGLATAIASAIASAIPPAWSTYTPSLTSGLGSITSTAVGTGRFTQVGKTVFCSIDVRITTNGVGSFSLIVGLPVASRGVVAFAGREVAVTGKMLYGATATAASTAIMNYADNTYPGIDGGRYVLGGSYEVP